MFSVYEYLILCKPANYHWSLDICPANAFDWRMLTELFCYDLKYKNIFSFKEGKCESGLLL